jgi:hypothetical protein
MRLARVLLYEGGAVASLYIDAEAAEINGLSVDIYVDIYRCLFMNPSLRRLDGADTAACIHFADVPSSAVSTDTRQGSPRNARVDRGCRSSALQVWSPQIT